MATNTTPTTTLSTSAASTSSSMAAVVILNAILSAKGITLTPDVTAAISVLLAAVVHYLVALKLLPMPKETVTPVVPPAA